MISLIRNDDRLIHGQCMTRLVQHFKLKRILVIDDMTANNPILKMVFTKSAMNGMVIKVFTHNDFKEEVEKAINDNVSTMIVFRFPTTAKVLFDTCPDLPKSVMVGPCQMRDGCVTIQNGTYLSQQEVETVRDLVENRGIEVYFQTIPDMKRLDWDDVKKSL